MKSKAILSSVLMLLMSIAAFARQPAGEYLKRGKELFEKKNYLQAQENFEKAIELNPSLAEAYYFRGRVQLDDKKADADFTKAIGLKPDYPEAYFRRGLKNDLNNDRAAAMRDYNKAIELNPKFIDAYMTRAVLYLLDHKGALAIADYTKVLELKPDGDSYYVRGNTYLETGEYPKAVADLTRSIQLDPTYYWSYKQRAKAYRKLKRFRLAAADERKAAEIGPPSITQ
ncbi:MAG TPA: tetratricopeptide repeat protein [Pyrinomonadaceae bacterium]|jgi:tetratricopeptide (TPR) repeat protein